MQRNAATDGVWTLLVAAPAEAEAGTPWVRPTAGQVVHLDGDALRPTLAAAPREFTEEAAHQFVELLLPDPDGGFQAFDLVEAPVMADDLAARYPEIRTYRAQGIDDPHATARLDWTPQGFHAQVLTPRGAWYIDPYTQDDTETYSVYYKRDAIRRELGGCQVFTIEGNTWGADDGGLGLRTSGANLRTYRLACAATGEYTQFHGGTVNAGLAAIVTAINRVTGIYENEVAARLELVANNDLLVYTNGNTDPYSNTSGGTMLGQNQSNCDSVIGSANYDIGHVFSTGGGGVAFLGVVCGGSKAGGVTGQGSPIGDPFYVDYVAHEMGHQFGANHNFNGVNGSCGGNRNGSTANEPGSGSTIMGYAGICGADNLQSNSDPYFNGISYDEIRSLMSSRSCHTQTSTGNNAPSVDAGPDYVIPQRTPFTLTATATDPQGDPLTYCWEQMDTGPSQALSDGDNGSSPLFRSREARVSRSRTFPQPADLRNNSFDDDEKLPTTARTMTFRVTARDNVAGGGGVDQDEMVVTTTSGGPFRVTSPNTNVTWGGAQTVTWDVAGTSSAPVSAAQVEIALSTDGGRNFDTILVAATPNDGIETVVLPDISTTEARIQVRPTNNIFFDFSDVDFTIEPPPISIVVTSGIPDELPPGTPLTVQAEITDGLENVDPGSATLRYRFDGGAFSGLAMAPLGGALYEATIPAADCGDAVQFFVEAAGDGGTLVSSPSDAPATTFDVSIGMTMVVFADDFESDLGWTALDDGAATSGYWQRGVPVNDGGWDYDPISDGDGSGSCFLTQNESGNTDVDDGTVRLRSPGFDMSATGDYTIRYDYYLYLTNDDGTDQLLVEIRDTIGGGGWTQIAVHDTDGSTSWRSNTITQAELDAAGVTLSSDMQLRFSANDGNPQSINEAGVDGVEVSGVLCTACPDADGDGVCDASDVCPGFDDTIDSDGDGIPDGCECPGDVDGDGDIDLSDLANVLGAFGGTGSGNPADLNGDGVVDLSDLAELLANFGGTCP